MKYLLLLILTISLLQSCSRALPENPEPKIANRFGRPVIEEKEDFFGLTKFGSEKRGDLTLSKKGGNHNPHNSPPPSPPPGLSVPGVILLDFDGQVVENTNWNLYGPLEMTPSGLDSTQIAYTVATFQVLFDTLNITVTTDESVYYSFPINRRQRIIYTQSSEWYCGSSSPCVGGVSFLGTLSDGSENPSFVFTQALSFNTWRVTIAGVHEAGHTLGLLHQALYTTEGIKLSDYRPGVTMGIAYDGLVGNGWTVGPTSISFTDIQRDLDQMAIIVGYKTSQRFIGPPYDY